jgi:hypothetical protein
MESFEGSDTLCDALLQVKICSGEIVNCEMACEYFSKSF